MRNVARASRRPYTELVDRTQFFSLYIQAIYRNHKLIGFIYDIHNINNRSCERSPLFSSWESAKRAGLAALDQQVERMQQAMLTKGSPYSQLAQIRPPQIGLKALA